MSADAAPAESLAAPPPHDLLPADLPPADLPPAELPPAAPAADAAPRKSGWWSRGKSIFGG
jgi:hypothetical protein